MMVRFPLFTLFIFFSTFMASASAEEVRVAVASNFTSTLKKLVSHFERNTRHRVRISAGSSGKFYIQIKHGAPFDAFFSADARRPQLLEEEGLAVPASRFTYALGRLTLWSPDATMITKDGPAALSNEHFDHLAIANPKTAPYGTAAQQTLIQLGLWAQVKDRIVQGENIGQTFHFVFSKNAQLGFVALSQILDPKIRGTGSYWDVPEDFYEPLLQQAVLLTLGQHNKAAKDFLDYVKSPEARNMIEQFGYGLE